MFFPHVALTLFSHALSSVTANLASKNMSHFIYHTIELLREACEATQRLPTACEALLANCTFHSRLLLRTLIETSTTDQLLQNLTYVESLTGEESPESAQITLQLSFPLLGAVCHFLIAYSSKINGDNLYVYREVIILLLTLMATQLGATLSEPSSTALQSRHVFLDILMMSESAQLASFGDSVNASQLISTLLGHVVARKTFSKATSPSTGQTLQENDVPVDLEGGGGQEAAQTESAWAALAELGKFFAFPFQEFARMLMTGDTAIAPPYAPFGDLCLYPVLLLLNYQSKGESNPYRSYLSRLGLPLSPSPTEMRAEASSSTSVDQLVPVVSATMGQNTISFASLYSSLVLRICEDSTLLLLYMLLQINQEFRIFLASRADLDTLVLPLLQNLYRAHEQTRSRVYTIMIILTILSCDEHFIQTTQAVVIDTPSWFKEKFLRQLPLPEFMALVILRTSYLNTKFIKDSYLQENCMACLGNLATQLTALSFYTAKRFLFTAQLSIQRYNSLLRKSRNISVAPNARTDNVMEGDSDEEAEFEPETSFDDFKATRDRITAPADSHGNRDEENPNTAISMEGTNELELHNLSGRELLETLESTENHIRTILEVIDCMFRRKPASNVQLIYALILEPDLCDTLLTHQRLYDIAALLKTNVEYFLNEVQKKECESATQVVACLSNAALQWKTSQMSSFSSSSPSALTNGEQDAKFAAASMAPIADLKFCYEETNGTQFFTPCIWKLLIKHRGDYFYWNPNNIVLYEAEEGVDPNFSGDDGPEDPPRNNVPENV